MDQQEIDKYNEYNTPHTTKYQYDKRINTEDGSATQRERMEKRSSEVKESKNIQKQ